MLAQIINNPNIQQWINYEIETYGILDNKKQHAAV